MKFLSPRSDASFKKLFGHKDRNQLTKNFLNAILNLSGEKLIKTIELRDTKQWPSIMSGKEVAFDVYCIDQNGNHFIIEMQSSNEYNFCERAQYYVSRALANQLKPTQNYLELVPVIFIGIISYDLAKIHKSKLESNFRKESFIMMEEFIEQSKDVISQYSVINRKTGKILPVPLMEFHFIELPKFHKTIEECTTIIDEWLFFMKEADACDHIPAKMEQSQDFVEAFEVLNEKNWSNEEFEKYVAELDAIGREDRIAEGNFEEGAQKEKEAIAINALNLGLDVPVVAQLTGFSIEQIIKILQNL